MQTLLLPQYDRQVEPIVNRCWRWLRRFGWCRRGRRVRVGVVMCAPVALRVSLTPYEHDAVSTLESATSPMFICQLSSVQDFTEVQ